MANSIGWGFEHTKYGMGYRWKNNELAHFKGEPYPNLAREIIQNSLDAALSPDETVNVSFELKEVPISAIDGESLKKSLQSCLKDENGKAEVSEIKEAIKLLSNETIGCLVISDKNTTGLSGDNWETLVKTSGGSEKQNEGSGGSHGAGKNAPFTISPLRTIFYWTSYENEEGNQIEKLQGRTVLATHLITDGTRVSHIGFWGEKAKLMEISDTDSMPKEFRRAEKPGQDMQGTSVIILGFNPAGNWREQIARGVVSNFFYAIRCGKLDVTIEPDSDEPQYYENIDSETLDGWFEYLLNIENGEEESEDNSDIRMAWLLHSLYTDSDAHKIVIEHEILGDIVLYIRQANGMPNRVGIIRGIGMLITDKQAGLLQFPGFKPFLALAVMEDTDGNVLLKRMENVQHNAFSHEWLPEDEQKKGKKALKDMCRSIKDAIKKIAGKDTKASKEVMEEIARLLPEINPEDDDIDTSNGTPNWKDLTPKPGRKKEKKEKDQQNKPHTVKAAQTVPIAKVRIVRCLDFENVYKLSFTPEKTGEVVLAIDEQGGYSTYPIDDIEVLDSNMNTTEKVSVTADAQTTVFVRSATSLDAIRCKISAKTEERSTQS